MTRKIRGTCAYCLKRRTLTRDHVPPRIIFAKPLPSNLITVRACDECNQGFSKDDHYFGLVIRYGIDEGQFPRELAASIEDIQKLGDEKRRLFAKRMLSNHGVSFVDDGSLIVPRLWQRVEQDRVRKVLRRVVRGLYLNRRRMRLPLAHRVWTCRADAPEPREAAFIREHGKHFTALEGEPLSEIGSGVFTFRGLILPGYGRRSFWYMSFFHKYVFLAATYPAPKIASQTG